MISALQSALRAGATPETLKDDFGIKWNRHPEHPNLVLFKYDQINSPKMNLVVQTARGHILDSANDWAHVCRPFDRFLCWGEDPTGATPLPDLSRARVLSKEDGSLVCMWFYQGSWRVSTKGISDAGGGVEGHEFTFQELFWRTFQEGGHPLPPKGSEGLTFIFELCCAENRVVCLQPTNRVVLLAVRDNLTGLEQSPSDWGGLYPVVQSYPLQSLDQMKDSLKSADPLEVEGFVVAEYRPDGTVVRSKVKNEGYLILSHLKFGLSPKSILDILRKGEEGEVITYFPELTGKFGEVRAKYEGLVQEVQDLWGTYKGIENQKDFALAVKGNPLSGFLFLVRRNGGAVRELFMKMDLTSLHKVLSGR